MKLARCIIILTYAMQFCHVGIGAGCFALTAINTSRGDYGWAVLEILCFGVHAICFHVQGNVRLVWRNIYVREKIAAKTIADIEERIKQIKDHLP